MPRAKQLTVSHENLPGMLASIAKILGNEKVNILSCLTMTSGTTGTTHVVVDNVDKARKALANARLPYTEADVLRVELPNTPGALARFAGKLAQEDINIILGYQTSAKRSRKASMVLAVSDLDKADHIR
ncbi:MAG TPA: ACT domain-containing protein [Terriglobales bacterium]|nr:ACT domain-containing protein [Terriglobales bacterium]